MTSWTTRLAPSPTGALHLGNARTFLLNALLAEHFGWDVRMRMEDLDGPRTKPGADRQAIEELQWLGLHWQGATVYQSTRGESYREALQRLIESGWAYPCTCSRGDILRAGSAPHAEDGLTVYPGTCRERFASAEEATRKTGRPVAWRVRVPEEPVTFEDDFAGPQHFDLRECGGDFVVFKNDGLAAYQLAVVVDDDAAGVNVIVRGDDLLESTARQVHLRRLLGMDDPVRYWHLPLVVGPDGRRLAKRHGDTRLATYIGMGVPQQRIWGLLAWWSGQVSERREVSLLELRERFDPEAIPHHPIVCQPEDDAFLRDGRGDQSSPGPRRET